MKKNKKIIIISLAIMFVITGYFLFSILGSQSPHDSSGRTITPPPIESHKTFEMIVGDNIIKYLSSMDEFSRPRYLRANEGDVVTINITVDEDNELVLHDYDVSVEVIKDEMAELTFTADKVGTFNLELTHTNTDLGIIEVFPLDS